MDMSIHAHEPRSTTTRSIGLVGGLFLIGLASLSACDVGYKPLGGNGETGNGDGDGDNDGPEQELPGAALDWARYCPDLSAPPLQKFAGADSYFMGGCGDLLMGTDDNQLLLARIDGTTEQLGVWNKTAVLLSPRGRLVARQSVDSSVLSLRDLDAGTEVEFGLTQDEFGATHSNWGFVISKSAPGARLWVCDSNALDLVIDGAREPLATDVNCETVTQSGMHSLLAYATLDDEVMLADTDTLELSPSGLVGFEFDETFEIGDRRDALELSTTGPYLTHIINTVQDSDGANDTYSVGQVVFDVEHGVELASNSDVLGVDYLATLQAAVFGAPLFILDGDALSVAVDDVAKPIAEGTNYWRVRPTAAGPVYVLDEQGEFARISGPAFATHEVVLTADSANERFRLSSSGEYGAATGETDVCATPACASRLFALRRFGPDGPLPPLLGTEDWGIAQVLDDGAVLALGAPVDGPFDTEVTLPKPRLLLIDGDGAVLAEHPAHPAQIAHAVALADGRIVVALGSINDDELLVVDPAEATIEPYPGFDTTTLDIHSIDVDALGRRIVIYFNIGLQKGTAWGKLQ